MPTRRNLLWVCKANLWTEYIPAEPKLEDTWYLPKECLHYPEVKRRTARLPVKLADLPTPVCRVIWPGLIKQHQLQGCRPPLGQGYVVFGSQLNVKLAPSVTDIRFTYTIDGYKPGRKRIMNIHHPMTCQRAADQFAGTEDHCDNAIRQGGKSRI